MTNEEILKKAIEKAWKSGYEGEKKVKKWHYLVQKGTLESIIFSHDFAKAFWGEEIVEKEILAGTCGYIAWKYHLQVMILEEDPINIYAYKIKVND